MLLLAVDLSPRGAAITSSRAWYTVLPRGKRCWLDTRLDHALAIVKPSECCTALRQITAIFPGIFSYWQWSCIIRVTIMRCPDTIHSEVTRLVWSQEIGYSAHNIILCTCTQHPLATNRAASHFARLICRRWTRATLFLVPHAHTSCCTQGWRVSVIN